MWWKAQTPALARVADRASTIYVEHALIGRDDNAVALIEEAGDTRFPATMIATLLLGPGTTVCWVGENGVRTYAHGVSVAHTSRYLLQQAKLVSDPKRRLAVARSMYAMRFPGEDVSGMDMRQLRGREGVRVRRAYRLHASRTGVPWSGRKYKPKQAHAAGDDINRLLSALHACLYGVCHAAIVGVGASPALGFVHTGSAISFVLDIADLYKAMTSIPLAFDLAAEGVVEERAARLRLRDLVVEQQLMDRVVRDVRGLLFPAEAEKPASNDDRDDLAPDALWDDTDGNVPGGRNYAADHAEIDWSDLDQA
jgi:CRISPR-associated protein Cas1